jgi:predicted  nucleic acid-binding Zn-ribbon protein
MRPVSLALIVGMLVLLAQAPLDAQAKGRPFQQVQQQITSLQSQVDGLNAQVAALAQKIEANTASVEELGGVLLALEARLSGAEATLADQQAYQQLQDALIEQLFDAWQDAEAALAQNSRDIQRLLQADQALQALLAAVRLDVNAQQSLLQQLAAAVAQKQQAIQQACPAGSSIRQVTSTGGVVCEVDDAGSATALVVMDLSDVSRTAGPFGTVSTQVMCPSGFQATGGGYHRAFAMDVFYNGPSGNGWQVAALNPNADARSIRAFVKCARI